MLGKATAAGTAFLAGFRQESPKSRGPVALRTAAPPRSDDLRFMNVDGEPEDSGVMVTTCVVSDMEAGDRCIR